MISIPTLQTPRMMLIPSHPRMARETLDFYARNAAHLQGVEPRWSEDFLTLSGQKMILRQELRESRNAAGVRFWMARPEDGGRLCGCVALNHIIYGAFRSCFLAYKTDCTLLRQGYGAEAVNAAVDFAFRGLLLHRVEANIMPRNEASLALARRCGFREEGRSPAYLCIDGVWEEHIHMVRLNEAL